MITEKTNKYNVYIFDESFLSRHYLVSLIKKTKVSATIKCISNIDKFCCSAYSVVFIDLDSYGNKGIEIAKQLKERCSKVNIVFVTVNNEYLVNAFEVRASDILMKPFSKDNVEKTFNNLINKKRAN